MENEDSVQPAETPVNPNRTKFHFVLGMHRSGTSAVSGLLEGMGLSVGKAVLPSGPDNPLGFYENSAVVDFHDRLLEEIGSTWHDPRPLGKRIRSLAPDRIAEWRDELSGIGSEQFAPGRPCVVKDPRLCRLLPLWEPVIAASGVPLVTVLRHPAAVAASLSARNGFSADKALMLWLVNNLEMERESRAFQREFVLYSELLRNPGSVCRRLQQRLNLPEYDVDDLIRTRLRPELSHQSETWPAASARLRSMCETVFEILQCEYPSQGTLDTVFLEYEEWVGWLPDEFSGLAEMNLHRELVKNAPEPRLHLEVFADRGKGYNQSASLLSEIVRDEWQTIRIEHLERLQPNPERKLRIDPVNRSGFVTLSSIRIFREGDGTLLYAADTAEDFRKIELMPGLVPCFGKTGLTLLAMGHDPQMLLPAFGPLPGAACTLEITFKMEPADAPVLQQFRELHDLRAQHEQLRAENARCNSRIGALQDAVESAVRWQRGSWFRKAFHRWRPPKNTWEG